MGLRPRMALIGRSGAGPRQLGQDLQSAPAPQLTRRPAADQPRSQRPWAAHLAPSSGAGPVSPAPPRAGHRLALRLGDWPCPETEASTSRPLSRHRVADEEYEPPRSATPGLSSVRPAEESHRDFPRPLPRRQSARRGNSRSEHFSLVKGRPRAQGSVAMSPPRSRHLPGPPADARTARPPSGSPGKQLRHRPTEKVGGRAIYAARRGAFPP